MRQHKYNAKKTTVDGITFDSKAEARRYGELKLLQRADEISHLKLQPEFLLLPSVTLPSGKKQRAIKYRADFSYVEDGRRVIEDVKGMETAAFKLKAKLFHYRYRGLELRLVK